jgi:hypothetical protein
MSSRQDWSRSKRNSRGRFNTPNLLNYVFSEGKNSEPFYVKGIKERAEKSGYILKGALIIDDSVYGKQGAPLVRDAERMIRKHQKDLVAAYSNQRIANVWIFF